MMNEAVSSIMTKNVVTVDEGDLLSVPLDILKKKKVHHIPVVHGRKLVGIITTSDLFWINKSFEEYPHMRVRDVMTKKVATLEPDDKIGAAAEVLMEHLFHAIPIVNEDHELVGIVTSFDILRYNYLREYPEPRPE